MNNDLEAGAMPALAERLVVAPATGVFAAEDVDLGCVIHPGDVLGWIMGPGVREPVVTCFRGVVGGKFATPGRRVRAGEPIVWLRPASADLADTEPAS